jgi:hypothetical protein
LGVRELVLEGRIGTCSDPATQSSWLVLLAPQPTTAVHPLPGTTWLRHPITRSDVFAPADRASGRKPWQRPAVRADNANIDRTPEPDRESKTDDTVETTAPNVPADTSGGVR